MNFYYMDHVNMSYSVSLTMAATTTTPSRKKKNWRNLSCLKSNMDFIEAN